MGFPPDLSCISWKKCKLRQNPMGLSYPTTAYGSVVLVAIMVMISPRSVMILWRAMLPGCSGVSYLSKNLNNRKVNRAVLLFARSWGREYNTDIAASSVGTTLALLLLFPVGRSALLDVKYLLFFLRPLKPERLFDSGTGGTITSIRITNLIPQVSVDRRSTHGAPVFSS